MTLEDWQVALRKEFGREQKFKLVNEGEHSVFSTFRVTNPTSGGAYRVIVRGRNPGDNHCTCPDFSINTLGTCKHIEFTLGKLERRPGGKRALREGYVAEHSEVYLRYNARRDVILRAGASCPPTLKQVATLYFDVDGRLMPSAYSVFGKFLEQAGSMGHRVICHDDVLDFIARARDRVTLRKRVDAALGAGEAESLLRKLLKVSLYPYQREGALFAAGAGRSLIADDMGLGKTIQAIAAAEILATCGGVQRVLIVCPTSLKHQWKSELEKFTNRTDQDIQVVEGLLARRTHLYRKDSVYKITNYDVIHRDMEAIRQWSPDLVVLDEAQRIKNWQTRVARSVKQLESPYAIVLTGTPLENRLEELYSIVEFVDRDRLGPMFRFLHEHQHQDDHGRVIGYRNLDRIGKSLSPILIRRTRKQVLKDLPPRLDKRLFVPMTPQQQAHHDENRDIVAKLVAKWRSYRYLSDADQRRLMIALQNMRMSCNSTYLLDQTTDFGVKVDELCDQLGDVFEDPDAKVVIFSQWLRTHELLSARFKKLGWGHVMFHGGVPGPRRKDLVRQFKQDPLCRCFLSTDAGGVGLNLQHASVVVNVDQPWNPAVLEQRIARVHRLGQLKPVRVIHLIAKGTIEEGMLSLIDFKQSMFTGALDGGDSEVFLNGTKLNRFIQTIEQASSHIASPMATEPVDTPGQATAASAMSESPTAPALGGEWGDVAAAAISFIDKLRQAVEGNHRGGAIGSGDLVSRDPSTGQTYLRIPLPDPKTLETLMATLSSLVGRR